MIITAITKNRAGMTTGISALNAMTGIKEAGATGNTTMDEAQRTMVEAVEMVMAIGADSLNNRFAGELK